MSNTVRVHIEGSESVSSAVDKAIAKLKQLDNKSFDIDVKVDTDQAHKQIEELEKRIQSLRDHTVHIKVDTKDARDKIRYLHTRLDELGQKKPEIDVDTRKARDKIRYLIDRQKLIGDTKVQISVDNSDALSKIAEVKAALAALNDEKVKIKIDVDSASLERSIKRIFRRMTPRLKVDIDRSASLDDIIGALGRGNETITKRIDIKTNKPIWDRLDDLFREREVEFNIQTYTAMASLEALETKLNSIPDEEVTVRVNTYTDDADRDLRRAIRSIPSMTDDLDLDVDINFAQLESKIAAIRGALKSMDDLNLESDFDIDTAGAMAKLAAIEAAVNSLGDARLGIDIDSAEALAQITAIEAALDGMADETIDLRVDVDTAAANAELAILSRDRRMTVHVDVDTNALQRALGSITGSTFGRALGRNIDRNFNAGGLLRGLSAINSASGGVLRGLANITARIPGLGAMFGGLATSALGAGNAVASLGGKFGKAGGAIGQIASAAISATGALTSLGVIGVLGTAAITAGAYAAVVGLGAIVGIASAASAALGIALAAPFVYFASKLPEVSQAFSELGTHVSSAMQNISAQVGPALVGVAAQLRTAFDSITPSLDRMAAGTSKLIESLGGRLPMLASKLGPALEKAFATGSKHLETFANALPGIVEGFGNFMEKLGSPAIMEAATKVWSALPGIIEGVGDAINYSAEKFNQLTSFLSGDSLAPMREGFQAFADSLNSVDWSSASAGMTAAMNAFGQFAGSIDMQNIADGIGSIGQALASLTNVATTLNLDGMFASFAKVAEMGANWLANTAQMVTAVPKGIGDVVSKIADTLSNGQFPTVDARVPFNVIPEFSNNSLGAAGQGVGDFTGALEAHLGDISGVAGAVDLKVPVNAIAELLPHSLGDPGAISPDAFAAQLKSLNLPPVPMEFPVEALPKIYSSGTGLMNAEELKAALAAGKPIQMEVPVEALPKLLQSGAINAEQFASALKNLPPQEVEIALKALPRLVEAGVINPGQLSDILYQSGAIDLPIDLNIIPQAINSRELTPGEIGAQLGNLPPIQKEVVIDVLTRMRSEGKITEEQLQGIIGAMNAQTTMSVDVMAQIGQVLGLEGVDLAAKIQELAKPGGQTLDIPVDVAAKIGEIMGNPADLEGALKAWIAGITGLKPEEIELTIVPKPKVEGPPPDKLFGNLPPIDQLIVAKRAPGFEKQLQTAGLPPIEQEVVIKRGEGFGKELAGGTLPPITQEIIAQRGAGFGKEMQTLPPITQEIIAVKKGFDKVRVEKPAPITQDVIPRLLPMPIAPLPPIQVPVVPNFQAFALGIAGMMGIQLPPIKVPVVPDFAGFAAGMGGLGLSLPPIRVPVIPDFSAGGFTPMLPPVRVPVIFDIPPISIPQPPAVNVQVTSNVDQVIGQLNSIPTSLSSTHTVSTNADSVKGQILSLNGLNTSSTHTINIVTTGGSAGVPGPGGVNDGGQPGGVTFGAFPTAPRPMGIAGFAGTEGLTGAAAAGGMGTDFNYTGRSGGSLLTISNIVKNSIIDGWKDVGAGVGASFAEGLQDSETVILDALGNLNTIIGSGLHINLGSIFAPSDIGTATQLASKEIANGITKYVPSQIAKKPFNIGSLFSFDLSVLGFSLSDIFAGFGAGLRPSRKIASGSLDGTGQMIVYNHYETMHNQFDGGLVGDPERQAKRVLDVLEIAGSSRRANAILGNGATTG